MALWIDQTYLRNAVTPETVTALGLDDLDTFTQFEAEGRGKIASAMAFAGYPVPTTLSADSISTPFLQSILAPLILRSALQLRKGIRLPTNPDPMISEAETLLDAVHNKRIPVPGMQATAANAYGGSQASPVTGLRGRPSVFGPGKLSGF